MNNYTEFNSKSFLIILFLICAVFLVLIIKAFSYIPDTNTNQIVQRGASVRKNERTMTTSTNTAEEIKSEVSQSSEQKTENLVKEENKSLNAIHSNPVESEALENIDDLPQEADAANSSTPEETANTAAEPTAEEKAMKIFLDAEKLKKDKQYVKAIEEYQKISTVTNDTNTVAKSYEEIATIYAIVKRYGTALSYAQKAYNMSPSSSREMLLARLYYKTGDMDKATRRVNNILQRDFSADR